MKILSNDSLKASAGLAPFLQRFENKTVRSFFHIRKLRENGYQYHFGSKFQKIKFIFIRAAIRT